jgi:type I restriction enzyme S subunit
MGWPRKGLPELCHGREGIKAGPFGSSLKKDSYTDIGPRVYGQEQVIAGDFKSGDYHISEAKYEKMLTYSVQPDDILMSLVGTFGRVVVVPKEVDVGIINPRLVRLRPRINLIRSLYLAHVLTSPSIKNQLARRSTGGTMGVLNATLLKQLRLPVPSLPLQEKFANWVSEIRDMEMREAVSRRYLDNLFQSMLHRAFAVEL